MRELSALNQLHQWLVDPLNPNPPPPHPPPPPPVLDPSAWPHAAQLPLPPACAEGALDLLPPAGPAGSAEAPPVATCFDSTPTTPLASRSPPPSSSS
ncbi:unnamed protein product [Ilex paraguariensis]|uniref:Uncharacterized protein n=1 Tax=Ilex paraguariensis TaxID=185542 RepID=A0ABC8UHK4_9AQUA